MRIKLLAFSLLALVGCSTSNTGPMTHAAFTAAVTLGEQFALEKSPESEPFIRAAVPVVCGAANGTNVSPALIVAALQAAGVTNITAKIIINGSLALFNVVVSNLSTNQTEVRAYAQDLCSGLEAGLPPQGAMARRERKPLPPHLP